LPLIDSQILFHEAIIDWIEAFKKDKEYDPKLVSELNLRLKEQENSLANAKKLKQKQSS
jgi:hypothetical protein